MINLNKRIDQLEKMQDSKQLLFPNFLLMGLPEHLSEFHNSGSMARFCTLSEAGKAVVESKVYELIKKKYDENITE